MKRAVSPLMGIALCVGLAAEAGAQCAGDCDGNGRVSVAELVLAVRVGVEVEPLESCPAADADGDGRVRIEELIAAVGHALRDDCGSAAVPLMMPELAQGYFSFPWPNDLRRTEQGGLEIADFPGVRTNPLLGPVLEQAAAGTFGFGTQAAVFFQFSGALDPSSLPAPEDTAAGRGGVLLAALDGAAAFAPLLVDFKEQAATLRPANLLALLPYPGHPLRGATRYAAVLFRDLRDASGLPVSRAPLIDALESGESAPAGVAEETWQVLQAQWTEVREFVAAHTARSPDDVVAFTVFTTQDVTFEMEAMAAAVAALPSPTPVERERGNCSGLTRRQTIRGTLDLPKWQAGEFPYFTGGGEIVVEDGMAVRQGTERVEFEVTFPCGPAPANGWPILLFMDGTGAGPESRRITELGASTEPLPYVVLSIAPLYSGDRAVEPLPPPFDLGGEAFLFFNYLNPIAGRTNQLQQAADMLYLERIAKGLTLAPEETDTDTSVETDDELVVVAGHSQGALTVPQILASDPTIDGGFISAGGGGLYHSLLHRGDIRPMVELLAGGAPGELDEFHPVLHLVQTIAEIGDAANYAPSIDAAHVVSVGGLKDGCSPWEVVAHLGTALGLPVAAAGLHPTFGSAALEPPVVSFPVAANLQDGRTGVTVQLDTGHFGASTNPGIGRSFVESLAAGDVPEVAPPVLESDDVPGCEGRYDPLP